MTYKPVREFSGAAGQPSKDAMGPEALSRDLDKVMKMFNPDATHDNGEKGGIGKGNLNFNFGEDGTGGGRSMAEEIGSKEISELKDPSSPSNPALTVWKQIKAIVLLIVAHFNNTNNPHSVTKTQVGLGNVDNTSDIDKPISTATQNALNGKVDKVPGKGLSTYDYDDTEKDKVRVNTLARHSHSNKALLDTYTLSNDVLASAVASQHTHSNKSVLDGIVEVTQTLGNAADKVPSEKAVVDAIAAAGGGDMVKAVYDPTNKNQDVFAYMDTHKNNTSNPHQTTAAQVGAPSMTTSDLIYYVNVATGSDSNDGLTEGTAFKTIQKALNSVPQIINHRVIINIAAGTYNEAIITPKITGHATLRLVGASKATTFIQTITSYVDCNVLILEALNIRTITSKSGRIQLTDCTFDYANDYGIVADDGTVVELVSVGISNKTNVAILSRYGAVVILVQVSGSGNTKALSAQYGGKISRGWGNTITGTTQEERLYGGIIVDESGIPSGVLPLTGGTISGNLAITGALTRNSKTVYDTGNITISTSAPGSALAEGAIHMVY